MATLFSEYKDAVKAGTFTEDQRKELANTINDAVEKSWEATKLLNKVKDDFLPPKNHADADRLILRGNAVSGKLKIWMEGVKHADLSIVIGKASFKIARRNLKKILKKWWDLVKGVDESKYITAKQDIDNVWQLYSKAYSILTREDLK